MIKDRDKYVDMALREGAADAVGFVISDIAFDARTLLKCKIGRASCRERV